MHSPFSFSILSHWLQLLNGDPSRFLSISSDSVAIFWLAPMTLELSSDSGRNSAKLISLVVLLSSLTEGKLEFSTLFRLSAKATLFVILGLQLISICNF